LNYSLIKSLNYIQEIRLHRTRNVLARAGLIGVLPDEHNDHHRDKHKENVKTKSISFWNLSNDFYYDSNTDQDFLSKRRINSSQVFLNLNKQILL
jgi:hypothetical protein